MQFQPTKFLHDIYINMICFNTVIILQHYTSLQYFFSYNFNLFKFHRKSIHS